MCLRLQVGECPRVSKHLSWLALLGTQGPHPALACGQKPLLCWGWPEISWAGQRLATPLGVCIDGPSPHRTEAHRESWGRSWGKAGKCPLPSALPWPVPPTGPASPGSEFCRPP